MSYDDLSSSIEVDYGNSIRERCPFCGEFDCVPPEGQPQVAIIPYSARKPGPDATFTVDRDVWQKFWISPKRESATLLYSVGAKITPEEADRVGLTDPNAPAEIYLPSEHEFSRRPVGDEQKPPAVHDDPRLIGGPGGHSLGDPRHTFEKDAPG